MEDAGWLYRSGHSERATQWLVGALVLVLIALAVGAPLLVLLALAVALALGVALLWRHYGLREVRYTRVFSHARAFPGDEVFLDITVENAKLLPLPWLEIEDEFPNALGYPGLTLEPAPKPKVAMFHALFSVRPFERVRRRYRVSCTARGYHRFGPVHLRTGDVFGLATRREEYAIDDYLMVYPRVLPVTGFGLPAVQPFGDERPYRRLLEDPLRFRGVRPYQPGDAPRHIHWRASARSRELQTRQFEPSAQPTLAVFLDVNTFEHFWQGIDPVRLELAVSVAASLAAHGLAERRQVGLYVNTPAYSGERFIRLLPSRHPSQLTRILEALATLIPYTGQRIEALIDGEARRLPWGATIVVVTSYVTAALEETLATLHRTGHAITLVAVASSTSLSDTPGLTIYRLGEEAAHAELAAVELA